MRAWTAFDYPIAGIYRVQQRGNSMIEIKAVLTCDRCGESIEMENIEDISEVWQRLRETDWCDSDDGELVCPACWEVWDQERSGSARSLDAVDPHVRISSE